MLDALLDKYADEGITNLEDINVLKVQPIDQFKVQVKSTEGSIGDPVVSALYGKVAPGEYGLLITLGSFTNQARNFAVSKSNLRLIDGEELVSLILSHYEQFDARYKGLPGIHFIDIETVCRRARVTIYSAVSIFGMILDVLGAVVLARSFVFKRPKEVFRDVRSLGVYDFPITRGARDFLLSWLVQAIEARTGAAIICLGFAIQAIAQFTPSSPMAYIWLLPVSAIILTLAGFFAFQKCFVSRAAKQATEFYNDLIKESHNEEWERELRQRRDELCTIAQNPREWLIPRAKQGPL